MVRGGRNDCVRLNYSKETHADSLLHYIDKNAFYASIAIDDNCQVPVGRHEYIFQSDIERVQIIQDNPENAAILIDGENFVGGIKCVVLIPRDSFVRFVPILQTKCRGKIVVSLCHACSFASYTGTCTHNDMERAFFGDFLSFELLHAMKNSYKVLHWWEIISYKRTSNIFAKFMKVLAKERLAALGFPDKVESDEEKERYVSLLNAHHGLNDNLALTVSDIKKNELLVKLAKLSQNCIIGRFSLNTRDVEKYEIIKDPAKFLALSNDKSKRICYFKLLDKGTILLTFKSRKQRSVVMNAQAIVGGWIPQVARQIMWEELKTIEDIGGYVMFWDTDSVCFRLDINKHHNLVIEHNFFGMWKYEVDPQKVFR